MDNVCEALDEAKAEIQILKLESKRKEELVASLKQSQNEQLVKIQEANSRIEKQGQELIEKEGEISVSKQRCEDLKCSLNDKESMIKHLRNANDKLRVDCDRKSKKLEEENKVLVSALEEANEKNIDQEQKISSFKVEIDGLKGRLAVSQKKCIEAEKKMKAAKERREGDHTLLDLEEENRRIEDQLKWKKEQFKHLEDAHEKLREKFKKSEKEWQMEKYTLVDEISSLQASFDSQTRISEDLQKRLEMCHQALAHEESRRKRLEAQLSEFQTRFENALSEGNDVESEVASRREEEIGALRSSLSRKEMMYKEMEYQAQKLEQDNQELLKSLKDLREAQIHESGSKSSTAKIRTKLKAMEQKYQDCAKNLRTKEAEWSLQLQEVTRDFNDCKSELEGKDRAIEELKAELECSHSLIMQLKSQPEESELSSKLDKLRKDFNDCKSELEGKDRSMQVLKAELESCHSLIMQLKSQPEESELSSKLEKLRKDFNDCKSELKGKDRAIEELKAELESCHSLIMQLKTQTEEFKKSSKLEKLRKDLNDSKFELEGKDRAIEELKAELESCHSLIAQIKSQPEESELSSKLEKLRKDFNDCKSELEGKDRALEKLTAELECSHSLNTQIKLQLPKDPPELSSKLEKLKKDFNNCRSKLERKDTAIEELKLELESSDSLMTQLKLQNQDWSSQLENIRRDFTECRSELASKVVELEGCTALMTQLKFQIQETELKLEKTSKDFNDCKSESETKDRVIEEMLKELEDSHSQRAKSTNDLMECRLEIEELAMELEASRSGMVELVLQNEEMSVMLMLLKSGLSEAQSKFINERDEKVKSLTMRIEALVHIEEKQFLMQKELERYKCMLAEASSALERANSELVEKICEGNELEFELQIWKSFAKRLMVNLEENYEVRKELEASLLAQIEIEEIFKHEKNSLSLALDEKDRRIDSLHKQIVALTDELRTRQTEAASSVRAEAKMIEGLRKQLDLLEQESMRRELEDVVLSQIAAEKTFEHDKQNLVHLVTSLEEKLNSTSVSFSAQLSEKQEEINMASDAFEKIISPMILSHLEIEEKKLAILELEDETHNLHQSLHASKQRAMEIEAEMEKKMRNSDLLIDELKREKQNLHCLLGEMDYRIDTLSSEDEQLMETLGRIVDSFDNGVEPFGCEKENVTTAKTIEVASEGRSPFREVNI